MARNLYFGIDLGTTNTVVAWGQLVNGKFISKAVELRVFDEKKSTSREKILPSCVYYRQGENPVVGAYAHRMISTQSRRVIRSAKSFMGTDKKYMIDQTAITPSQVSAEILKQAAFSSREFNLGAVPDDAVITVPASFDPDQRADTNEAARLAGFRLTEDDGTARNILLNEPAAALYDFLNRQDNGEIPEVIDLSSPKVILVYDIGGGTLDVSLHEVAMPPENETGRLPYEIKPYAISRHTLLGGDNFDELLRDFLMTKIEGLDLNALGEVKAESFRNEILYAAEKAKKDLNAGVENYRMFGEDYRQSGEEIEAEIIVPYIAGTGCSLSCTLTLEEYRARMEKYLASDLTISSLEHIDKLTDRTDNIIYPVLDVLSKAKSKLGTVPKIDAVLLNGGMSKLFAVRERIEAFFGFAPLETGDPDLAVARGASVYHYWRHQGIKTPEIQNDDIGIEIQGGTLLKLILAGTTLPYTTKVFDQFATPEEGTLRLDLPFYKGTRSDTQPPNVRIAARRIRFTTPQAANTPVMVQGHVDEAGTLSLKVWKPEEPDKPYTVDNVHPDKTERYIPPAIITAGLGGFKKRKPKAPRKTSREMNIPGLIREYEHAYTDIQSLKPIENDIVSAANSFEAIDGLARIMTREPPAYIKSERAAMILGQIARSSPREHADRAVRHLEGVCDLDRALNRTGRRLYPDAATLNRLKVMKQAVIALRLMMRPEHERLFLSIFYAMYQTRQETRQHIMFMTQELCYGLGMTGHTEQTIRTLCDCLDSPGNGARISAYWGLGRAGSREQPEKCPARVLEEVLPSVFRYLKWETHPNAIQYGAYALGELCDQREKGDNVSRDYVIQAQDFLLDLMNRPEKHNAQTKGTIQTSLSMISGAELSTEQKEFLLSLRTSQNEE